LATTKPGANHYSLAVSVFTPAAAQWEGCNGAMGGAGNNEIWRLSARAASVGCVDLFGFGLKMNFSGTTTKSRIQDEY
jgi:hypothetical protein